MKTPINQHANLAFGRLHPFGFDNTIIFIDYTRRLPNVCTIFRESHDCIIEELLSPLMIRLSDDLDKVKNE